MPLSLPSPIQLSWQKIFIAPEFYVQFKQINETILAMERILHQRKQCELRQKLSDNLFWQTLSALNLDKTAVAAINTEFIKNQTTAHLSTGELLSLYQDCIVPLERKYYFIATQFASHGMLFNHWLPLLSQHNHAINKKVLQDRESLSEFKKTIFEALLTRCKIHQTANMARQIDDVLGILGHRLNVLQPGLLELPTPSATLSDDRRILIYDLVLQSAAWEKAKCQKIIEPINRPALTALKSQEVMQQEMMAVTQFRQQILNELAPSAAVEMLFLMPSPASNGFKFLGKMEGGLASLKSELYQRIDPISSWLSAKLGHTKSMLKQGWQLRHVAYLTINLLLYHYLIQFIKPVLLILMSESQFSVIAGLIFYTMALIPLWNLGKATSNHMMAFLQERLLSLKTQLGMMWEVRHLLYFGVSLIGYQILLGTLKSLMGTLLTEYQLTLYSSALFYGVALAPVWNLMRLGLNYATQSTGHILTTAKRQTIVDALITLENSTLFIQNHLNHTILDVAFFEAPYLQTEVEKQLENLAKSRRSLGQTIWWEKFVRAQHIETIILKCDVKLKAQINSVNEALKKYSEQIAARIEETITLFSDTLLINDNLIPLLPQNQINALKLLVDKYGDEQSRKSFQDKTNVAKKWLHQLSQHHTANVVLLTTEEPWGNELIRQDSLTGWRTILETFMTDPLQKQYCLQLQTLLQGKTLCTVTEFDQLIDKLGTIERSDVLLQKIQDFLYKTLANRHPSHAALLSCTQKRAIHEWKQLHTQDISTAENAILQALADPHISLSEQKLHAYYQLLDGADINEYAAVKAEGILLRQNLVRKHFEGYRGESFQSMDYFRLLPVQEKAKIRCEVVEKRLQWILNHLLITDVQHPFNHHELTLFREFHLYRLPQFRDFSALIEQSSAFNGGYSEEMEKLLETFEANGLGTHQLKQYRAKYPNKNATVKPHPSDLELPHQSLGVPA